MNINSVEDAFDAFELADVVFYETSAVREDDHTSQSDGTDEAINVQTDSRYRTAPDRAEYRIKVTIIGNFGKVAVDASVQYATDEDFSAPPKVLREFGTNFAAPMLFPSLREAILTAGSRVGVEVKLAPFKPGDIPFH